MLSKAFFPLSFEKKLFPFERRVKKIVSFGSIKYRKSPRMEVCQVFQNNFVFSSLFSLTFYCLKANAVSCYALLCLPLLAFLACLSPTAKQSRRAIDRLRRSWRAKRLNQPTNQSHPTERHHQSDRREGKRWENQSKEIECAKYNTNL